jgi:hypothetical protein
MLGTKLLSVTVAITVAVDLGVTVSTTVDIGKSLTVSTTVTIGLVTVTIGLVTITIGPVKVWTTVAVSGARAPMEPKALLMKKSPVDPSDEVAVLDDTGTLGRLPALWSGRGGRTPALTTPERPRRVAARA